MISPSKIAYGGDGWSYNVGYGGLDHVLLEAESYDGPSLIIAYSHRAAHGIDISTAMQHQKAMHALSITQ